jgi:hypothetical protein
MAIGREGFEALSTHAEIELVPNSGKSSDVQPDYAW